ncbi:GNAT family N-acetyltransferase [Actinocatenispora sera]|uniref:GNAT family N-acetyltransferase n=1 Tax=Actinocatenispora sera TaxID=390989 RepID=UPI0033D95969
MTIRSARGADAGAVAVLLDQLGYPQDDPAATADRIRSWADDPAGAAYVAEAHGELLGVVAVRVCPYFERGGAWARITALVVSDRARRRGVGARLLAAAESFAIRQGCRRMEVTSADHRSDAHAFYRRRGYTDQAGSSSRFLRDLDTGADRYRAAVVTRPPGARPSAGP